MILHQKKRKEKKRNGILIFQNIDVFLGSKSFGRLSQPFFLCNDDGAHCFHGLNFNKIAILENNIRFINRENVYILC